MAKILYLTVGIPGSGKTTWANRFSFANNYEYINPDNIRSYVTGDSSDMSKDETVWKIAITFLREYFQQGLPVVFDATNYRAKNRKRLINLARQYGYKVVAYVFNVDLQTAKERNSNRQRVVPDEVIDRMYKNLQIPTSSEVDEVYNATEIEIQI